MPLPVRIILIPVFSRELHRANHANLTVGIGMHDIENQDEGYLIPLSKVILHEKFESNYLHDINDIALLRLRRPVKFNENVRPVCLPHKSQSPDTIMFLYNWNSNIIPIWDLGSDTNGFYVDRYRLHGAASQDHRMGAVIQQDVGVVALSAPGRPQSHVLGRVQEHHVRWSHHEIDVVRLQRRHRRVSGIASRVHRSNRVRRRDDSCNLFHLSRRHVSP